MSLTIRCEHLSKEYRLGTINHGMLFKDIQSWAARRIGQPDPHEKIGAEHFDDKADRFWALKDVSFEIEQGSRVGIIGRNGAGKSTLLKLLSRITAPTEGRIYLKGKVTSLLEVGTGFHQELTGRENIYLNGAILGMKRHQVAKKLDEIIAFSEIEKFIDTPVKRYSSGMYVRLAFAVAANLDSDILIADEVLAVGDLEFQNKCLGKMEDVSTKEGRTVLFVSHNMLAVQKLCKTGMLLEKGALKVNNSPLDEVIFKYLNASGSLGSDQQWENDGSLKHETFQPLSMKVVQADGKEITRTTSTGDEYAIVLEFLSTRPSSILYYYLRFFSEDNRELFSISPFDSMPDYKVREGHNRIMCRIPPHFLNMQRYRIELAARYFGRRWILLPGKNAPFIFFDVKRFDSNSRFYSSGRSGALAPFFTWEKME